MARDERETGRGERERERGEGEKPGKMKEKNGRKRRRPFLTLNNDTIIGLCFLFSAD